MKEIDAIQERIRGVLRSSAPDVVAAYLFGSAARGESRCADVDLAVLLKEDPPPTLEGLAPELARALEEELGIPVDLVVLNRSPADLTHRVLRDGVLLLDRDPSRRIRFEVKARNEFFDLEPIRRRYRSARRP